MKAFNRRKTCKEHYLFKNKFKKLSLINKNGGIGVFRVRKLKENNYAIFGDFFATRYCFKELKKVLTGSKRDLSIGDFIRIFEKNYKVKIEDIGLTRQDFYNKDNIEKINNALKTNGLVKFGDDNK